MAAGQADRMTREQAGNDGRSGADPAAGDLPLLTQRQQEILALLKAGKPNKEIAHELGIGVGTVKQHVVALFKKLNVTNRAMAVSRGIALQGMGQAATALRLERRPGTVLSIGLADPDLPRDLPADLPGNQPADIDTTGHLAAPWSRVRRALAALAVDYDATFVARPGAAADLIFGVHRAHEDDAARAVQVAYAVADDLAASGFPGAVRAGVCSGLLVASTDRRGGWTGEVVAGSAIGWAREMAGRATADTVCIGAATWNLLSFVGAQMHPDDHFADTEETPPPDADLHLTERPHWTFERRPASAVVRGRRGELDQLRRVVDTLQNQGLGSVLVFEGETGMGKTTLANRLRDLCAEAGLPCQAWRCPPPMPQLAQAAASGLPAAPPVTPASDDPTPGGLPALVARALEDDQPRVVVIDDVQWADAEACLALDALMAAAGQRRLVAALFSRPLGRLPLLVPTEAVRVRLGRLAPAALEHLIVDIAGPRGITAGERQTIRDLAAGVPLFAVELTLHAQRLRALRAAAGAGDHPATEDGGALPLSLITLVMARVDALRLDRALLRLIAAAPDQGASRATLAAAWDGAADAFAQEVQRAQAGGVLAVSGGGGPPGGTHEADQRITFAHPLVGAVLGVVLAVDAPASLAGLWEGRT